MFGKQIVYTPIPTGITVQSFDLDGKTHLYLTKKDGANCIEWRRHFIVKEVLDDVLQHEGCIDCRLREIAQSDGDKI